MSLIDEWKKLAGREGIILLAPNAADERGWNSVLDSQTFLSQIIGDVSRKANIDQKRLYIFGHSAGACYALGLALDAPEYYAAIAIHAGAITVDSVVDQGRRTPISIQVGTNDAYFPVEMVRETRDAFQTAGFPIELVEIKGHTHWYYDSSKKINSHAWQFLSSHRLD
jgi:predicted esterase